MIFEIFDRDILGRIGRLKTKNGFLNTPAFFPVINPIKNIIDPTDIKHQFKINQLMTNVYLIKQAIGKGLLELNDIHKLLNFNGVIMTDSGAYQILSYGEISITPDEVIELQEIINSDISVILDIPTSKKHTYEEAKRTVISTINNALILDRKKTRDDIIWVGPIQGGRYLDLVRECASKISKIPIFNMYGIGAPVQYMVNYRFEELVDIIINIKMSLPQDKPIHMFGAGHPIFLPMLVALGCDTFDSASYALFAKDDRYLTSYGTIKLKNLKYLPCICDVCRKYNIEDLKEMNKNSREKLLAIHNLWIINNEINHIKQAIVEGRLWELVEIKSKSHPQLFNALIKLSKYAKFIEKYDPVTKGITRGIFYTTHEGLSRPEVTRHILRLEKNVSFYDKSVLILVPDTMVGYRKYSKYLLNNFYSQNFPSLKSIHICIYGTPFGVIPIELINVYPLSHYIKARKTCFESEKTILHSLRILISKGKYKKAIIFLKHSFLNKQTIKSIVHLFKSNNIKVKIFLNKLISFDKLMKFIDSDSRQ
ncbi:MAG: tRNA guanosine(15) transglycosylase TgtA [Candidatus Methanomethylicia archaeon]|nr:tRNA guanosine(15) transglycosylase TgtA [Candidatus Methanomethylicia archaeon]